MAWIESHQEIDDHPKTRKCAAMLKISIPTMVGHLHILWHWALSYAQDGDLSDFSVDDIALAARWEGDADQFVNALVQCRIGEKRGGFLDRSNDGQLLIHDWWDYAGKLIVKRQTDAKRKRDERVAASAKTAQDVQRTSSGRPSAVAGREPYRTEEDSTEEDSTEEDKTAPEALPHLPPQRITTTPQDLRDTDPEAGVAIDAFRHDIGHISDRTQQPLMLDIFDELRERGIQSWWQQAIDEAVNHNKRSWSYIKTILDRCLADGRPPGTSLSGRNNGSQPKQVRQRVYDADGNMVWQEVDAT